MAMVTGQMDGDAVLGTDGHHLHRVLRDQVPALPPAVPLLAVEQGNTNATEISVTLETTHVCEESGVERAGRRGLDKLRDDLRGPQTVVAVGRAVLAVGVHPERDLLDLSVRAQSAQACQTNLG